MLQKTRKTAYVRQHAPFFYEWAGCGHHPDKETPEQGRQRGADALAAAEYQAIRKGVEYRWSVDPDIDSSDFSDEKPAWKQWQCAALHNGTCIASLHGIDFGRDGGPQSDPYARVVQAELAQEGLPRS